MQQQSLNDLPLVLSVKEAASVLQISLNTAYRLIKKGDILSVKVGRQYRIKRDTVMDYLSQFNDDCA